MIYFDSCCVEKIHALINGKLAIQIARLAAIVVKNTSLCFVREERRYVT